MSQSDFIFQVKMKSIWIVIGLLAAVSSCPDCCTVYVVLDTSIDQSPLDSCSCNITVDELSQLNWNFDITTKSCTQRQFLFQSGIHQSYNASSFLFEGMQSIAIEGVPNATIECQNETFCINFQSIEVIVIREMHFVNCSCSHHPEWVPVPKRWWDCELHVPISAKIKIINSKFINSRLVFRHSKAWQCKKYYKINLNATIEIKNIVVKNCCNSAEPDEDYFTYNNPFLCVYRDGFDYMFKLLLNFTLESLTFRNNYVPFLGDDSDYPHRNTSLFIMLTGHNVFTYNKGRAIIFTKTFYVETSLIISKAVVFITNNIHIVNEDYFDESMSCAAPICFKRGIRLEFEHCHIIFRDNYGEYGGGIVLRGHGSMVLNDDVFIEFSNNIGKYGGALNMGDSSMIFNATKSRIEVVFVNNSAYKGGTIFFDHSGGSMVFTPNFVLQCSTAQVSLNFFNNSAFLAGNEVFGGWIGWFRDEDNLVRYSPDTIKELLKLESYEYPDVASCPIRICLCKDGHPDCNITDTNIEVYGYAVNLSLVAIGENFTPVVGHVQTSGQILIQKNILQTGCTNLVYISHANKHSETLYFHQQTIDAEIDCDHNILLFTYEPNYNRSDSMTAQAMKIFDTLSVAINYNDCPLGFILHESSRKCACQHFIISVGLSCDVEAVKIRRNTHQWVDIAHDHTIISSENPGMMVHPYCPFDYCRTDDKSLLIHLEDQTFKLCAFNRSGILCGGCETNFSRVLGSSRCKVCSTNIQTFAIIFCWLFSGMVLVTLLILLDLTVSVGTINGLIFYANIIQAQHATFFPLDFSRSFMYKFIAWLNLDQGFETCLYNGLDQYTITYLQFLFPLYIWLIAAALIMISRCPTRISRFIGKNIIPVLATLFLMTYSKLLQLNIHIISFTFCSKLISHEGLADLINESEGG
jgi:hypothetical protein